MVDPKPRSDRGDPKIAKSRSCNRRAKKRIESYLSKMFPTSS